MPRHNRVGGHSISGRVIGLRASRAAMRAGPGRGAAEAGALLRPPCAAWMRDDPPLPSL
jgi:hypothetical protein